MGHGSYMDFGASPGKDNEFFAPLLDVLPGMSEEDGGNLRRDFFGMALTGFALTVPVWGALEIAGYQNGFWVVGIGKAFSYWIGWTIQPNDGSRQSPEWVKKVLGIDGGGTIGEWLWGAVSVSMLYLTIT